MKNTINNSLIRIIILLLILIFIINNIRPKISLLILSYNRPENLDKSLPILNNYYLIDEIIVSHGSKDYYKEFNYSKVKNIKDFENNKIYGASRRWFNVKYLTNEIYLQVDDDIIPSRFLIFNMYINLLFNYYRNTIYGSFKRQCNKNGYFLNNIGNNYDTILTGLMMCKKQLVIDYLNINFNKDKKWLIEHHGNGEDLAFNMFIRKYYNEQPVYISGSFRELNNSSGYSSMSKHYNERSEFCKKYS
jgi:hypothetical protein